MPLPHVHGLYKVAGIYKQLHLRARDLVEHTPGLLGGLCTDGALIGCSFAVLARTCCMLGGDVTYWKCCNVYVVDTISISVDSWTEDVNERKQE